jgi:hypothetical protein
LQQETHTHLDLGVPVETVRQTKAHLAMKHYAQRRVLFFKELLKLLSTVSTFGISKHLNSTLSL